MNDIAYFHNITDFLKNSTHPEIYHFRAGNHPGAAWYLKTVCPMPDLMQIDKFGHGLLWQTLAAENPESVKIIPHAYDWEGKDIPYMVSVWLNIVCDIIIFMHPKTGYNLSFVDRIVGEEYYINNIFELVELSRDTTKSMKNINNYLNELDEIEEIVSVLKKEMHSKNATQIRKELKVVDGGSEEEE